MNDKTFNTSQPSRLYHLKPIGIGTPYVESLTSYVKRLAEAHSVSPGILLAKEILPYINRHYLNVSKLSGFGSINLNTLNSGVSENIVRVLEEKTCNSNLKYLTMSTWKEYLYSSKLFRKNQAWCPICYEESLEFEHPMYEQLIWNLKYVDICGKHKVKLIQKCPYCNRVLSTLYSSSRIGYCNYCYSWLGSKNQKLTRNFADQEWHNWIYDNVGKLLSNSLFLKEVNNMQFSKNMIYICEFNDMSITSLAKEINIDPSSVYGKKSRLINVLSLSFVFGYSAYDILEKDIAKHKHKPNIRRIMPKFNNNKNKKVHLDEFKKILDEAIYDNKGTSISKLSKNFGIDISTVKKYFPEEVIKLKANNIEYLENCRCNKKTLLKDTIDLLYNNGIYPSKAALNRELGKTAIVSEDERKLWLQTLEELGCTSEKNHRGNRK